MSLARTLWRSRPFRKMGLLLFLVMGCAAPPPPVAPMEPDGHLTVLGPVPGFLPDEPPADWVLYGNPEVFRRAAHVVTLEGVPALRLDNAGGPFLFVRRVHALLPVSPFLGWSWFMDAPGSQRHPVTVVVGFRGGRSHSAAPAVSAGDPPPHDRVLALGWGESALQRGTLEVQPESAGHPGAVYIARGGRDDALAWWVETVDLAELYGRAWPEDKASQVEITFVGASAAGHAASRQGASHTAHISSLTLSR